MSVLSFNQTKEILLRYKIPFCKSHLVASEKEALKFAQKIGYPVVLKICSPDILHKTDVGGIKIVIDKKELTKAWAEILNNVKEGAPQAKAEGILVQKMISGQEVVVGMKRDPSFGPALMFGLGGIFVEVLKDVAFRVAPIDKKEALKMMKEIKGFKVLRGFRGKEKANIEKIAEIIVKVSKFSSKEENIREIDLNPVIVNTKQAFVVDPRFIIYEKF